MITAAARRSLAFALVVVAAATTACSTARGRRYDYNVDFMSEGPPWKEASHSGTKLAMTRQYVRPTETLADWHELLTVQVFDKARGGFPAPPAAASALRAQLVARCPAATWSEISADTTGVMYESRTTGCAGQPDQHEIARIVEGTGARARIAYARKGGAMPDSVRAGWIDRLRKARFTTTARR